MQGAMHPGECGGDPVRFCGDFRIVAGNRFRHCEVRILMGAKLIPHLLANLDACEELYDVQAFQLPYDMTEIASLPDVACAVAVFDGTRRPAKETQGPARLIASDQMESLLAWYV